MEYKTDHLSQLQRLNLSANEASVYLALLESGQTSAGSVIKKTELHRGVVYETLDRLIEKKLVVKVTKQGIAHFQATDPARLMDDVKAQEMIAKSLVPELRGLLDKNRPEIIVHEGIEAYRRFWIDSLKKMPIGSVDYVAGSIGAKWMEYFGPELENYFRIAKKRKISWKMIVFDVDDAEQSFLKAHPEFVWECRVIDKVVTKEGNFNIFGTDRVILHSATEPMVIEIKNASLVRVFQNLFDILWQLGKPLK